MKFAHVIYTVLVIAALQSCQPRKSVQLVSEPAPEVSATHGIDSTAVTPADSICIAAVGDIMLGTSYPDNSTCRRTAPNMLLLWLKII